MKRVPRSATVANDQTQPESDFDGAWKEALRLHFQLFLKNYFPDIERLVDWSYPPDWLDKEIRGVVGRVKAKSRTVDLVARVKLLSGESIRILIHVEVQTSHEPGFSFRVARYNAGLQHSRQERVVSLVILGDLDPHWMPDEDVFECGRFLSHYRFPTCKLVRRLETDWKDDWSLPVIIARAQIEALRTTGKPEARAAVKWRLVRRLYDLGLERDEILDLFRLIDWMVRLSPDLDVAHSQRVEEFEKEQEMAYVTSYERYAEARAIAKMEFELGADAVANWKSVFLNTKVEAAGGDPKWEAEWKTALTAAMEAVKAKLEAERQAKWEAEEKAEAEARAKAKAENSREVVVKIFGRRFGRIAASVRKQLMNLSGRSVDALIEAVEDIQSIKDLKHWLSEHEPRTSE